MGNYLTCGQCCDFYRDAYRGSYFEIDGWDMTLPKNLEEKRDELALARAENFWGERDSLEQEEQNSFDDIMKDYKSGWNACANLLLPEIEKLREALFRLTVRLDESASIHDIKPSAEIVNQALQSLRQFERTLNISKYLLNKTK